MDRDPGDTMPRRTTSKLFNVFVSIVGLLVSALVLLYAYAFARMVDPQRQEFDRWQRIFEKMFLRTEGIITWPLLFILIASSFVLLRGIIRILISIARKR